MRKTFDVPSWELEFKTLGPNRFSLHHPKLPAGMWVEYIDLTRPLDDYFSITLNSEEVRLNIAEVVTC